MKTYQAPEIIITEMPAYDEIMLSAENYLDPDDLFLYSDTITTLINEGKTDQVSRYYR